MSSLNIKLYEEKTGKQKQYLESILEPMSGRQRRQTPNVLTGSGELMYQLYVKLYCGLGKMSNGWDAFGIHELL